MPTGRAAALDVLRGLAILLVLFNHMPGPADALQLTGWIGVDLFFVLSGYLISGLLFRELQASGSLRIGRFLLRRGAKIWPSYFLVFGLWTASRILTLSILRHDASATRQVLADTWPNIVFIQNYFPFDIRWPHSWSLAIEEHFYIGLPFCLLFLKRRARLNALPVICLAIVAASALLRTWLRYHAAYTFDDLYYPTHLRTDGLTLGVAIGYTRFYRHELFTKLGQTCRRLLPLIVLVPIAVLVFPRETSGVVPTIGFSAFAVLFGIAVTAAAFDPRLFSGKAVAWFTEPLRRLGIYSYTVYLTHSVIGNLPLFSKAAFGAADRLGGIHAQQLLFFAASILSAIAISVLVEQPILRWRDKALPHSPSEARFPGPKAL